MVRNSLMIKGRMVRKIIILYQLYISLLWISSRHSRLESQQVLLLGADAVWHGCSEPMFDTLMLWFSPSWRSHHFYVTGCTFACFALHLPFPKLSENLSTLTR